jgi:hypothetical protein
MLCAVISGFGSQLFTRLRRTTNDENFGFQPGLGLGINALPGFSGEESALPPAEPDGAACG